VFVIGLTVVDKHIHTHSHTHKHTHTHKHKHTHKHTCLFRTKVRRVLAAAFANPPGLTCERLPTPAFAAAVFRRNAAELQVRHTTFRVGSIALFAWFRLSRIM